MASNLVRSVKNKRKVFCKYIDGKMRVRENVGSLLNERGDWVTHNTENAEILNAFFTSVFTSKTSL